MTEKRFKYTFKGIEDTLESDEECKYTLCDKDGFQDLCEMLNELNDENERLKEENQILKYIIERNNNYITDLVSFIKSKGYALKDFLKYVSQFRIVEVNKGDWNE